VYSESQGGAIRRSHAVFRQYYSSIRPNENNIVNLTERIPKAAGMTAVEKRRIFRTNWSTPFILSPHNPRTLYYGTQYLLKSVDRGDTWTIVSPDLTTNDPERTNPESGGLTRDVTGAETNATIITISESPIRPGLIWIGTDDGKVQVTPDDGANWNEVTEAIPGLPAGLWISRVRASQHDVKTAYVTVDGHRSDNFHPYVFKTIDLGKTWTNITNNMPDGESVYVITEDPVNPQLLFLGSEFAAYVSVDGGKFWHRLMNDLPTVAIHDLVIHPRDRALIAGTHGRSVWIMDDITPLEQLNGGVLESGAWLFEPETATIWKGISRGAERGHFFFQGRNPLTIAQRPPANSPSELQNSAFIHYYLESSPAGDVSMEISDLSGKNKRAAKVGKEQGINRYQWDLRFDPTPLEREFSQVTQKLRGVQSDQERQRLIEEAQTRLWKLAETESQRREVTQRLEMFQSFEPGEFPAGFGAREPQGPQAGPGVYLVRLTVEGKTYSTALRVRTDPLLEEFQKN
jgi:hypothetical protein